MAEFAYPALVVVLGYTVLGITGFGSALVIVPLLAWRWPLPDVVALTLLMDVPASALHSGLNMRQVNFAELRHLLPGIAAGSLAGIWLAGVLEPRWPLLVLGLYIVVVGAHALRPAQAAQRQLPSGWAHGAGLAIGLVEMLFGTAGPVVVAWLNRRLPDLQQLRASTPLVIVAAASTVLLGMGWAGRLSDPVLWQRWGGLMAVALGGVLLGNRLARHIPAATLKRIICGLLVISGLMLIHHAWG